MFRRLPQRRFIVGLAIVVPVVALSLGSCGGAGSERDPGPAGLTTAVERRDASALVTSLGGDPADPGAHAAAEALLGALPQGTTFRLVAGSAASPRLTYEVTVPGAAPRRVSFQQVEVDDGGTVLLPATEEAP